MACHPIKALPEDGIWLHEAKLDGYRAVIVRDGLTIGLRSRKNRDLSRMFPTIVSAALSLRADRAVVDGELVALDDNGLPSFQALQHRGLAPHHELVYYAFDVLHLEGRDLIDLPLEERRAKLSDLIPGTIGPLRISRELPGSPSEILAAVKQLGLEGIVSKRWGSTYKPGERSRDWVKFKFEQQQAFVIGGYRSDGEQSVDALAVGYYDGAQLRFGAKVRAGFVRYTRRELAARLAPMRVAECPFPELPTGKSRWGSGITDDDMRQMHWTSPQLVAQIRFTEWTEEGRLRNAFYLGLRHDKTVDDLRRETSVAR